LEVLRLMGIPPTRYRAYPHEFSGGMRQRLMIALTLVLRPAFVVADEPTTALDVLVEAQIIRILHDLRSNYRTALLLITHNLGIIAEACDRVAVMYAGEIVEQSDVTTLFRQPLHPYTRGLIGSIPVVGAVKDELAVIPGNVPNLIDLPKGCRFAPRCQARIEEDVAIATEVHPALLPVSSGHAVRCWMYHDAAGGLLPRPDLGAAPGVAAVSGDQLPRPPVAADHRRPS
jgi:peptide/nickel transport system ATP-binding protein